MILARAYASNRLEKLVGGGPGKWTRDAAVIVVNGSGIGGMFPTIEDVITIRLMLGNFIAEARRLDTPLIVGSHTCVTGSNPGTGTGEPTWITYVTSCRAASKAPSTVVSDTMMDDSRSPGQRVWMTGFDVTFWTFWPERAVKRTLYPLLSASKSTRKPMSPVAPVMSTRGAIACLQDIDICCGREYGGTYTRGSHVVVRKL